MIFIVISILVGIGLGIFFALDSFNSLFGRILGMFFGIPIGGFCVGVIGCLIPAIIGGILYGINVPQERILKQEQPIYSVVDNKGVEGNFALGYGRISDTLKYYYIIKDNYGQKVDSTKAENTHIINTNDKPEIKIYHTSFKNKLWDLVAFNFKEENDYILEVPNNTIKYDYNIDLK